VSERNTPIAFASRTLAVLGCALLCVLFPLDRARAFDAITIDTGYGLDDTRLLRLNFSVGDNRRHPADNGWHWSRSWEGNISYWYLYKNKKGVDSLLELGLTPNFRLERDRAWDWGRPYLEAGLGVHLLSKVHIGTRDLSSALQFGTHAGLGIRFGSSEQFELAWRIEHLSNAGLKEPNPGINFTMTRFSYRW
jgi:lipid A 3-O-deacylase